MQRRPSERAQESTVRREREDAATRLLLEVPALAALRLEITQGSSGKIRHTRRVIVERAPALFEIACVEPSCRGGGHDLTRAIMDALRPLRTRFEGEDSCRGLVGSGACRSVLRYQGIADYREGSRGEG
jgi:hypothetical protein